MVGIGASPTSIWRYRYFPGNRKKGTLFFIFFSLTQDASPALSRVFNPRLLTSEELFSLKHKLKQLSTFSQQSKNGYMNIFTIQHEWSYYPS